MFTLKSLSPEAVPAALEKALRYRMLNEPEQAASICEDVLQIEPENQEALTMLILALTDTFGSIRSGPPRTAHNLLPRLRGAYEREYYAGIIYEREAIAWLRSHLPRSGRAAHDCFRQAMGCFERAEALRPPANDDARLRWNSCGRMLNHHADSLLPEEPEEDAPTLGE